MKTYLILRNLTRTTNEHRFIEEIKAESVNISHGVLAFWIGSTMVKAYSPGFWGTVEIKDLEITGEITIEEAI